MSMRRRSKSRQPELWIALFEIVGALMLRIERMIELRPDFVLSAGSYGSAPAGDPNSTGC